MGLAPGTVCRRCLSPGTLSIYGRKKQVFALERYHLFHSVGLHLLPAVPAGPLGPGAGYLLCAWSSDWVPTKGCEGWLLLAPPYHPEGALSLEERLLSQQWMTEPELCFALLSRACATSIQSLWGSEVPWPC